MRRNKLLILGIEYNKTNFDSKWTEVTRSTECNYFVRGDDEAFINEIINLIPKWKIIKDRGVKYKIRNKKFQGRAVKGIVMITANSKREIWLGKGKVIEELFPKTKAIPEYKKNRKDALVAMRQIIEPQIKTFRLSVNRQLKKTPLRCKITGEFVNSGEFHIDHSYPFKNLVEEWCREEKIDLERLDVYCKGTKCYFKDTDLAERWFDYHVMNARLQVLSATANLKKGAKYYGD